MWSTFFVAMAFALALFFAPGFLALSGFCGSRVKKICYAPLFSIAAYGVLAMLYGFLEIRCTILSVAGAAVVLALACFLIGKFATLAKRSRCVNRQASPSLKCNGFWLYLLFGVAAVGIFFIKNLDGPSSFFQAYDNVSHLGTIRAFIESGNFSPFASVYPLESDVSPFFASGAFYPSAWHTIVSLVALASNASITSSVNAVNASLIAVVFPAGMYLLLDRLFGKNFKVMLSGALVSVSLVSCPWDFVIFGPLYPNLLALAMVPAGITAFMLVVDAMEASRVAEALGRLALFFTGCVAIALAHPNGIFTMAVFLAPFLVDRSYRIACKNTNGASFRPALSAFATVAFVLLVWSAFYFSPTFDALVHFNWVATTSPIQAVIDVITFGMASAPAQPLLTVSCLFGFVTLCKNANVRWTVFPYLFAAVAYVLCVSTEGFMKHYFAGFWYTDPHRIAALVGLFSIPLIAVGTARLFVRIRIIVENRANSLVVRRYGRAVSACVYLLFALLLWFPNFELRGIVSVATGFGYLGDSVLIQNDEKSAKVLTHEEEQFARKALKLVPDGSLVINSPNDGSAFLYALDNANILYRSCSLPSADDELQESIDIRMRLDELVDDVAVRDAVERFGAEYVLLLDQGADNGENRQRFWSYFPDQWTGVEGVTNETPGFSEVLSEGDMSLLKIEL